MTKYKKVFLINPYPEGAQGIDLATVYPPLGLLYIASVLRENNIEVQLIDANVLKIGALRLIEKIISDRPDLVGISMNLLTAKSGIELSRRIKDVAGVDICIGGPFVSSNSENILNTSGADFIVVGEGERIMLDVCKGKPLSEIKGIVWKSADGREIVNSPAGLIENLDEIPMPAYDLLPSFKIYRSRARRLPMASIFTSRGCSHRCVFCNRNIFGEQFRAFSVERVIAEIDFLVSKYKIKQFDILDDYFCQDMKRAEQILDGVIEKKYKIAINLQNGIRVDKLTRLFVKKMRKAGVFKIGIGCESGDRNILREIQKDISLNKVKQAVRWFRQEGIIPHCFFIIGFPQDTRETIKNTINFAIEANPVNVTFCIFIPFPGTQMYAFLEARNLLMSDFKEGISTGFFGMKLYHKCLNLSHEEILEFRTEAYKRFYLRFTKICEIIFKIKSLSEARWYGDILKTSFGIFRDKIPFFGEKWN